MENRHKNLMSSCSEMNFGKVEISDEEKKFCRKFNNEIILLCKSLPKSTHTDAILFFTEYLVTPIGRELNFFANYYTPAWSIIFWLIQACPANKRLDPEDIKSAITAHTMALFLHPLDDHLNDGQLPATHLHLLLRSQSWMIMHAALNRLYNGVEGGAQIGRQFIDHYYQSICNSEEIESLDRYCGHFRNQMATWLIIPVLLTKKIASDDVFIEAIQIAYGSFGIAWRLLDDIRDIENDMNTGTHSAIYVSLPEEKRKLWDNHRQDKFNRSHDGAGEILNYLLQNSVIERLAQRICSELESAASLLETHGLTHLADEFRCLLTPLVNRQTHFL
ncbi:MAG: hypothetical protein ACYSR9_10250 [Planctomycetota bacterium]|jgi:hypothetical protein